MLLLLSFLICRYRCLIFADYAAAAFHALPPEATRTIFAAAAAIIARR